LYSIITIADQKNEKKNQVVEKCVNATKLISENQ